MEKHHYPVSEVMKLTGRTKQGVYKMLATGALTARRLGRGSELRIWVTKESVVRWMLGRIRDHETEIAELYANMPEVGTDLIAQAVRDATATFQDLRRCV